MQHSADSLSFSITTLALKNIYDIMIIIKRDGRDRAGVESKCSLYLLHILCFSPHPEISRYALVATRDVFVIQADLISVELLLVLYKTVSSALSGHVEALC